MACYARWEEFVSIIDFEFIHMEFHSFEETGRNIIITRSWWLISTPSNVVCHDTVQIRIRIIFDMRIWTWGWVLTGKHFDVYISVRSYWVFPVISNAICRSSLCNIICRNCLDAGSISVKLAQHRYVSCAYDLSCYCYSCFVLLNQESFGWQLLPDNILHKFPMPVVIDQC